MAKTKISEFDSTPANNTDIDSINIAEGCAPSGINNAIRELMSQLKDQQTGASGDNFTVGGNLSVTGTSVHTGATTFTGAVVMSTALPVASGGTGASTAGNARTNLSAASSGSNSDITSITGLTTALTAAQGGTGLTSSGTSGNVLVSSGSAWTSAAAPTITGSVVQVVSTALTGTFTMTGQTQTAITGLTASITPKNSANKILVMVNIGGYSQNAGQARFILTRASTDIGIGAAGSGQLQISFGISGPTTGVLMITGGMQFLDSPATTSATTYGVTVSSNDVGGIVYINRSVSDTSSTSAQRSISTITVMEIAG